MVIIGNILSQFFYGASSFVLKGYSGTAQNAVAAFSWIIMNYVGVLSCTVIAVTTTISLIKQGGRQNENI